MSDETVATDQAATESVDIEAPSAAEQGTDAQVADETQTAEPTPQQEEAQAKPKPRPKSRAEARRQAIKAAKDLAPKVAEAKRKQALEQPREEPGKPEGGQFKKAEDSGESESEAEDAAETAEVSEVASEPEAEAATPAEADSTDDGAAKDTEPAPKDDGFVTVPIPDGHPLRDQGKESLRVPADSERDIRTMLNAAARSRELERAQEDKARLEARLQALQGDTPNPETDPVIQELLRQVEEAEGFGPELRAKVEAAFSAQQRLSELEAERGAMQGVWAQRVVSDWSSTVDMEAHAKLEVWAEADELSMRLPAYKQEYLRNLDAHNERLPDGNPPMQPTTEHFFRWLGTAYKQDPRVQAKIRQMTEAEKAAEKERIRAEVLAEANKKREAEQADQAARHATRPPSAPASTTQAPQPVEDDLAEIAKGPNRRRALRKRVREIGQQYAGS